MDSEDVALQRLLDEGSVLAFSVTAYGSLPGQVYETCAPDRRGPVDPRTLVVVHGGYFRPAIDRTHARPMARALALAGWHVVLAEYRRTPGNPSATTDDLATLDAHLREAGQDVVAWVGHSAGGALVMWRALHQDLPPTRALALAPVADFDAAVADHLGADAVHDWIGADPQHSPDLYARLDPTRLLATNSAAAERISILHGDEDGTVPLRQTQGWARTVLPGAHHFDVVDPASPHWPSVLTALAQR